MDKRATVLAAEELRARIAGKVNADGSRFGSDSGHRTLIPVPGTSRRRCGCGCNTRATHVGLGDGVALITGCELRIRRWAKDPK